MKRACLLCRSSASAVANRSRSLFSGQLRQMSQCQESDELKNRVVTEITKDPTFLRDVIKMVRHKDPKLIEATNLLADYVIEADRNKDGVVTKEELKLWLRRQPVLAIESDVRYVPEEANQSESSVTLTSNQIRQHFIKTSIPFVGFGFLDNFIMIISGSEIESYFGLSLGISAMAAAGLGNTLSDIIGLQAGGVIEALSDKLGIVDPDLTKEQMKSKAVRFLTILASIVGITIGCLLGMIPLLFIDTEKEIDKVIRTIFDSIDKDKSGKLELHELDALFELLCRGKHIENPQQAGDFMRSCGFDEHDSLTYDEFKLLFNAFVQKSMLDKQANEKKSLRHK